MTPRPRLTALAAAVVVLGVTGPTQAQAEPSRDRQVERLDATTRSDQRVVQQREAPAIRERLRDIVDVVIIEDATAEQAFNWWAATTHIPLVINWQALELEGIDREQRINLLLHDVPAGQLLAILMQQASPDVELLFESTPWYVQVMTRREANKNLVLKVYHVEDLIMDIPHFEGPSFDLNDALSNTSSGGSTASSRGGGNVGGGGLFPEERPREQYATKAERGAALADTVRNTVEPTLWDEVEGASVSYFDGKLIVNAPLYVHRKIGLGGGATVVGSRASRSAERVGVGDLDPIGGVNHPTPVAAIQGK